MAAAETALVTLPVHGLELWGKIPSTFAVWDHVDFYIPLTNK